MFMCWCQQGGKQMRPSGPPIEPTSHFYFPRKWQKMWALPVLYCVSFPWSLFLILLRFRVYTTFQKSQKISFILVYSLRALWKKLKFPTRMFSDTIYILLPLPPFGGGGKFLPQAMQVGKLLLTTSIVILKDSLFLLLLELSVLMAGALGSSLWFLKKVTDK